MLDLLDGASGEWLAGEDYRKAFGRDFWRIGEPGLWKLESRQTFQEPNRASWLAFACGDWAESLRLIDVARAETEDYFEQIDEAGFRVRRARVVEYPVSPYLHWQLHFLRMEEECGQEVSVVTGPRVEELVLPELVTLGSEAMYELVHNASGGLEGGVRFTDPDLIARCTGFIEELYDAGEQLKGFFEREVTTWDPPRS